MKKGLVAVLVVLAVIAALVFPIIGSYNSLVDRETEAQNAFSNIDVQLQRRADLIPNLVNTVKGFAQQETEIFTALAEARSALLGAGTIEEKVEADNRITAGLGRLLALQESYPELKSSEQFLSLQDELAGTENRISVARKDYNNAATAFNRKLRSFPTNVIAGMFGFEKMPLFEAAPGAETPPTVDFGS